ncbi:MAG TPA: hypothetical protein VFL75_02390, partial [Candidatus Limnocylindria bacterium]|nr:hypothetical protein [Candidatus Limnocylindria bacterium]
IPRVFDESDRIAAAVAGREVKGELPADAERLFAASQVDPDADLATEAAAYRPPFGHLALLLQIPGVDVRERAAAEKGGPLESREDEILAERIRAARGWLESYAPDKARIVIHRDALPDAARALDDSQHAYLAALADRLERADWVGEAVQAEIFSVAQELGLKPGVAFSALYAAFLGERSGPRAGWLLAALDREFVVARLREAAAADTLPA